jgi:hypothetical protein
MGLALLAEAMLNGAHLPMPLLSVGVVSDRLEIPLKQALLAAMCGVSRGIFSICIKQLANAGWCEIQYATISLLQIEAWVHFSSAQRHSRTRLDKPDMPKVLALLQEAARSCQDERATGARHA